MADRIYSVTGITRKIRDLLELKVGELWVEGEISNHRAQSSGHHYFSLKDESAQISVVMFRGNARGAKVPIENGIKVQVFGELSVYEARGQYQLMARLVQGVGQGELQARFDALKAKLDTEGLFDSDRKKPVVPSPETIAIVTSPTGAALQDMLNVLARRAPWVKVLVYPVRVQGKGSGLEVAKAVRVLSKYSGKKLPKIDTVVVARGGGSLEDLWAFNEEVVARAIADCEIPVVSGVGHEIDFTIADFAADLRAPTPSAAAELIVPDGAELRERVAGLANRLDRVVRSGLREAEQVVQLKARELARLDPTRLLDQREQTLDWLEDRLEGRFREGLARSERRYEKLASRLLALRPMRAMDEMSGRLDHFESRLRVAAKHQLERKEKGLDLLHEVLRRLDPEEVMRRGFSLVTDEDGKAVRSAKPLKKGDRLYHRFSEGTAESVVD